MNKRALLKTGEVSQLYGVHPDTVRSWERSGLIKAIRTPNGHRLFDPSSLHSDVVKKYDKTTDTKAGEVNTDNADDIPITIDDDGGENNTSPLDLVCDKLLAKLVENWKTTVSEADNPHLPNIGKESLRVFVRSIVNNEKYHELHLCSQSGSGSDVKLDVERTVDRYYDAVCAFNNSFEHVPAESDVFTQQARPPVRTKRHQKAGSKRFWLAMLSKPLGDVFDSWFARKKTEAATA